MVDARELVRQLKALTLDDKAQRIVSKLRGRVDYLEYCVAPGSEWWAVHFVCDNMDGCSKQGKRAEGVVRDARKEQLCQECGEAMRRMWYRRLEVLP